MTRAITEPARLTPAHGEYDVVVPGAGRKTLPVERYGFPGGMGTAAGVQRSPA